MAGAYRMIADVKRTLDCMQFKASVDGESVLLNLEPLRPVGIDYVGRLPGMTAYEIDYETYFKYETPDRRAGGKMVREVVVEVNNTYQKGEPPNLPGVVLK